MSAHDFSFDAGVEVGEASLRRHLAEDAAECSAARLALSRLRRATDSHRQRLVAFMASRPSAGEIWTDGARRAQEATQLMEQDVRGAVRPDQTDGTRSGAALRRALDEAHRRCESLHSDMTHQASANDDLVENLTQVKDANRRLLEQIRQQTGEIDRLTHQRVEDEEEMDQLTRAHENSQDRMREETRRTVHVVRDEHAEGHGLHRRDVNDKLRAQRACLEVCAEDAARLQEEHHRLREDAAAMVEMAVESLAAAERAALARLGDESAQLDRQTGKMEGAAKEANGMLKLERELRTSEGLSWGHQHCALASDKEDMQSRMARDLSQLSSQRQSLERMLAAQRQSWDEERGRLEQEQLEVEQKAATHQEDSERQQKQLARRHAQADDVEEEIAELEEEISALRHQVFECDDALAAAVSGNEHLRGQMEEQRRRFQERSEADVNDTRRTLQQQIADARLGHEQDTMMAQRRLLVIEAEEQEQAEAAQALQAHMDATANEMEALRREAGGWEHQHGVVREALRPHEKEFADARLHHAVERLRLQNAIGQLNAQCESANHEVEQTKGPLSEFLRVAQHQEVEQSARHDAREVFAKSTTDQLKEHKQRLQATRDLLTQVDGKASQHRQRELEGHSSLEDQFEKNMRTLKEELGRLLHEYNAEVHSSAQAKEALDRERDSSSGMLRKAQEDTRTKLTGAEREKQRVEDASRGDITAASEGLSLLHRRIEGLEADLNRMRALLSDSEANHDWVQQEFVREDRDAPAALHKLGDEVRHAVLALEQLHHEHDSLLQQVNAMHARCENERKRLQRELEDAKRVGAAHAADAERTHRARAEQALDADRHRPMLLANHPALSSPAVERRPSPGPVALRCDLESHLSRLQRRTEELRSKMPSTLLRNSTVSARPFSTGASALTAQASAARPSASKFGRSSSSGASASTPSARNAGAIADGHYLSGFPSSLAA